MKNLLSVEKKLSRIACFCFRGALGGERHGKRAESADPKSTLGISRSIRENKCRYHFTAMVLVACILTLIAVPSFAAIAAIDTQDYGVRSPEDAARLKHGQPILQMPSLGVVTMEAGTTEGLVDNTVSPAEPVSTKNVVNLLLTILIVVVVGYVIYLFLTPQKKKGKKGPEKPNSSRSGYSLLEMIIVFAFISIAFLAILQLFSTSLNASADVEGTQMAIRLGENQMESLLNVNILQLTNEAKAPVSGFSQYSQQVTVTTVGSKERQIDVITYWKVKGTEVSFPLTTLVNRY